MLELQTLDCFTCFHYGLGEVVWVEDLVVDLVCVENPDNLHIWDFSGFLSFILGPCPLCSCNEMAVGQGGEVEISLFVLFIISSLKS